LASGNRDFQNADVGFLRNMARKEWLVATDLAKREAEMKDDIETLRQFIAGVCTDKGRREARPEALDALDRLQARVAELEKERARQWCESCGTVSNTGECDCTIMGDRPELRKPVDYADAMHKEACEQLARADAAEADRDSLRAKLERAKEIAERMDANLGETLHTAFRKGCDSQHASVAHSAIKDMASDGSWNDYLETVRDWSELGELRAVLAELSAAAPAQQTTDLTAMQEAMKEAEMALEPFATDCVEDDEDYRCARAALGSLRKAMQP
jgi:hypothetical protein